MRVAIFVLCLMVYCASTSGGLLSGGNIGSRIHRQNAQFGESVRDWFSNIMARILLERPVKNPRLGDTDKLGQGKFALIDLNTLKINPEKDWGFRIGNWCYIKHDDNNTDKALPILPKGLSFDDLYDESEERSEDLSVENGGEGEDKQTSSTPLKPDEVSIATESPNKADRKRDDENNIKGPHSAEILTPKAYQ